VVAKKVVLGDPMNSPVGLSLKICASSRCRTVRQNWPRITQARWCSNSATSKGVRKPREPKAKETTGGTEFGNSELTCRIVCTSRARVRCTTWRWQVVAVMVAYPVAAESDDKVDLVAERHVLEEVGEGQQMRRFPLLYLRLNQHGHLLLLL
jgi:hypothetical protein